MHGYQWKPYSKLQLKAVLSFNLTSFKTTTQNRNSLWTTMHD